MHVFRLWPYNQKPQHFLLERRSERKPKKHLLHANTNKSLLTPSFTVVKMDEPEQSLSVQGTELEPK